MKTFPKPASFPNPAAFRDHLRAIGAGSMLDLAKF